MHFRLDREDLELFTANGNLKWSKANDFIGATVRNRTADILITSEVLYHLSYGGLGLFVDKI